MWLLDTNICSFILKRRPPAVRERLEAISPDDVAVSAIVAAELRYGAARHPERARLNTEIEDFLSRLSILPWDDSASRAYGDLRAHLERAGNLIGNMDLLIAAHALARRACLVTNNKSEFQRVPGLRIEDWSEQPLLKR